LRTVSQVVAGLEDVEKGWLDVTCICNLKERKMLSRLPATAFLLLLSLIAGGCQLGSAPRPRLGCYPSATIGTAFLKPGHLGSHGYRFKLSERNGIVYTCKAGHIDVTHVRISADWTLYLAVRSFACLMKNEDGFSFELEADRSRNLVEIYYPPDWKDLSQKDKEQIACDISIRLGQYLAFTATTWHEILTWFGYKCVGFFPEFPSAFSWEDSFSNLLGTYVAAEAMYDTEHTFDEAMALAIDRELQKLGVQSSRTARRASSAVRGKWFSGHLLYHVNMKRRNFDIGLYDGYVTPTLVPYLAECAGTEAQPYPVPTLDFLSEYGFTVKFKIEPKEWEKEKILRIVYSDDEERKKQIEPAIHFARIMDYIEEDAVRQYGYDIGPDRGAVLRRRATAADINGDGKVDFEDFAYVGVYWSDGGNR